MPYLLKTEPTEYSFDDLVRDKSTVWDGITNPVALRNLRTFETGTDLVIYHTGDEKRTVGTAKVVSVDVSNEKDPKVTIKAGKPLKSSKTLAEIKANKLFADSPLIKIGRLSVVPLTEKQWDWLVGD
ncbi:MAG TPA: EVE domain-containing protein [Terriglobales bacterium]|jgi:predicted RNA-binding protein with PUA-like domain|nr:EVE domain-containing protein [Terriglobales bacterium]